MPARTLCRFLLVLFCVLCVGSNVGAAEPDAPAAVEKPEGEATPEGTIVLQQDMGESMIREATRVREELEQRARSMFERKPLGWDWDTLNYLYEWALTLPLQLPKFMAHIMEQSRVLGVAGSLIMLTFIVAVFYSLLGQKKVLAMVERRVQPFSDKIPETVYPFVLSSVRIVVASLMPLILLGAYALMNALIEYKAPWFRITGRLLVLWAVGGLLIGLLRESLTRDLFKVTAQYGRTIFQLARLALIYVLVGIAVPWGAEVFPIRADVLALLKFAVAVSIVVVLFLLHLQKKALLSLLPHLPYKSYETFIRNLTQYYFPLIFFSFLVALLWCIGYKQLGSVVLTKIWTTAGAYLAIMLAYHFLQGWLQKWAAQKDKSDEAAQLLIRSLKGILVYATAIATALIVLNLLGLLSPLQRLMSFPVLKLGTNLVTLWIIVKAVLILVAFIFASRLLQAYLDYKIYPSLGIDTGLGYALNTFLKYFTFVIGFLISLKVVGIDLRFLLVFAGAIGIGLGLGLQNMAANLISGFSIIFGGKIRKGDWIEVGDTLGEVIEISLRATKVRSRDNIEYIIPNSDFITQTVINYSLSSPYIRIDMLVGASYDADPSQIQEILLVVANKETLISNYREPGVRFVEYGDNSINFELLFWIDVRTTARRRVRSNLFFAIFAAFKEAGIEIPYPQRDLHIRTTSTPIIPT